MLANLFLSLFIFFIIFKKILEISNCSCWYRTSRLIFEMLYITSMQHFWDSGSSFSYQWNTKADAGPFSFLKSWRKSPLLTGLGKNHFSIAPFPHGFNGNNFCYCIAFLCSPVGWWFVSSPHCRKQAFPYLGSEFLQSQSCMNQKIFNSLHFSYQ